MCVGHNSKLKSTEFCFVAESAESEGVNVRNGVVNGKVNAESRMRRC